MGTAGPNWNRDTKDIIAWLRRLEKDQPLLVTGISQEHVSGRVMKKGQTAGEARDAHPEVLSRSGKLRVHRRRASQVQHLLALVDVMRETKAPVPLVSNEEAAAKLPVPVLAVADSDEGQEQGVV
jgi:hypothetical protein